MSNIVKKRYSKKEKAAHFAEKSKKGAVSNNGVPLTDFQRGRNYGRAEQINQDRGSYAWRKSDKAGRDEIQVKRENYKKKKEEKRAKYFAKLDKKSGKARVKV